MSTFDSGSMKAGPHRARHYTRPVAQPAADAAFEGETTVDGLLAYVKRADSDEEMADRAAAVLDAETDKPEADQRSTLVEPLEAILESATAASVDTEEEDEGEPES